MKLASCAILYNPDIEELEINIREYIDNVEILILWLNSTLSDEQKKHLLIDSKIVFMGDGTNVGISYALNAIFNWCISNSYTHILTMDQDSRWINFDGFLNYVKMNGGYIQYGPQINKCNSVICGKKVDFLITSGSTFNISKVLKIGGFRKDFFVDGIDIDFGYKAKINNEQIILVSGVCLEQQFGTRKSLNISTYSPNRLLEIVKTHWIIFRDYFPFSFQMIIDLVREYYIKMPIKIILFRNDRIKCFSALFKGTMEGLKWKK